MVRNGFRPSTVALPATRDCLLCQRCSHEQVTTLLLSPGPHFGEDVGRQVAESWESSLVLVRVDLVPSQLLHDSPNKSEAYPNVPPSAILDRAVGERDFALRRSSRPPGAQGTMGSWVQQLVPFLTVSFLGRVPLLK